MSVSLLASAHFSEVRKNHFYFILFLFIHVIIWTLGPYLARPSLTHDTLEGITWGLQWQWGYSKHPFLTAWLCAGMSKLFGASDWPIYLLAQLAVATTFGAAWQLARLILPVRHALIATLVLEAVLFYNVNSFNFTPDTLQSPLWALVSLYFYQAITTQKHYYWLLTGLFCALCVCTKYQVIVLFIPMLLFCVCCPQARISFKKSGIYWAIAVFLLLITPHLIWLYQHQFITLTYANTVSADYTHTKTLFNHLYYPVRSLINNLFAIVGVFILLWPFYSKPFRQDKTVKISPFQWQFLLTVGLGPVLCSLLLCALSGDHFPARWSTPYFFSIGILIVAYLKPLVSKQRMQEFLITFIIFSLLLFAMRMLHLTFFLRAESDAFLPNKKMALLLSKLWHEYSPNPLAYIAGSNYLVSLITPYMSDQPKPYLSWEPRDNPWINEDDIRKKGGLFIWDIEGNYTWDKSSREHTLLSATVLQRFPQLIILPNYTFYSESDQHKIIIGVGILLPQNTLATATH